MKFCPFLVAGQSLAAADQRTSKGAGSAFAPPDVDAILHDSSSSVDLFAAGEAAAATPAVPTSEGEQSAPHGHDDLGIVRFQAPARAGDSRTPVAGIECLGEPCRFFHAGGCRFDALFDSQIHASTRQTAVYGTTADATDMASVSNASGDEPVRSGVLDEVWSLQRESLREVMSGFQKVEAAQTGLQSQVASAVETQVGRVEMGVGRVADQVQQVAEQVVQVVAQVGKVHSQSSDAVTHLAQVAASIGQVQGGVGKVDGRVGDVGAQVTQVAGRVDEVSVRVSSVGTVVAAVGEQVTQVGHQVGQVGAQVGRVESQVGKVEGQVTSVKAGVATVESQLERLQSGLSSLQASVAIVVSELQDLRAQVAAVESTCRPAADGRAGQSPEILEAVSRHIESLGREVRQLEPTLRTGVAETLRVAVRESQVAAQQAVAASEVGLRSALEGLPATIRAATQDAHKNLAGTLGDSQSQLGSLIARAAAETRAQVERGLAKMLEELTAVRDARSQIEGALDNIVRESREVAVLARRVESSQVLTNELLDEQRQVSAKLDERERHERARQLNNAGVLSYHQGAYDTSVDRFKEATDLDPTLAEAFNNLGLSYTEMGRDEEATIAFQRALELDPAAAHVYNNLGYLYYRQGDLTHAVEMYQRAIQRGADSSAAYSNLANAYYRLKKIDQAVAAWRRALEIDPANHKAAVALERLGLDVRPQ